MTVLDEEALQTLLVQAARCVEAALSDRVEPPPVTGADFVSTGGGAFVTLRHAGQLAGCIGYVDAPPPLDETVRRAARAAALDDVRFARLRPEELNEVDVELSVLGLLEPVDPLDLAVGVHGAILRWRGRQGLLLPEVAVEHELDRAGFLAALCEKAGVPAGTERREDCELLAFTTQQRQGRLVELTAQGEAS